MGNFLTYPELDASNYAKATDSVFNTLYSMCIAVWTTIFVESWKQKQSFLSNRWLVDNFDQQSFDRKGFKASLTFDIETRTAHYVQENIQWKKRKGQFYSFLAMGFVISVYIGI